MAWGGQTLPAAGGLCGYKLPVSLPPASRLLCPARTREGTRHLPFHSREATTGTATQQHTWVSRMRSLLGCCPPRPGWPLTGPTTRCPGVHEATSTLPAPTPIPRPHQGWTVAMVGVTETKSQVDKGRRGPGCLGPTGVEAAENRSRATRGKAPSPRHALSCSIRLPYKTQG